MPHIVSHIAAVLVLACGTLLAAPASPTLAQSSGAKSPRASGGLVTEDVCMRVIEGDLIEGRRVGLIRLIGVIAPAADEPGGRQAIDYTRKLAIGKPIRLQICSERPNDYRNRVRAVVYLPGGVNLNTRLLRAGMARLLDHKPCHLDVSAWEVHERAAREAGRGLWASTGGGGGVRVRRQRRSEDARPRARRPRRNREEARGDSDRPRRRSAHRPASEARVVIRPRP